MDITLFMQNMQFSWLEWVASKSPKRVAKIPWQNFWKICLSVFRNWKVHLWASHEGRRESFYVSLQLELSLMNKSPSWVMKKPKTKKFWNFSKYFSRLGDWLTTESQELLSKLMTRVSRLAWLMRVSRQNRVTKKKKGFSENFQNKTLSKNNSKYSKIFLCLINIWLSMYNTFNQLQLDKWIRHSLYIDMCDVGGYQMWDSP